MGFREKVALVCLAVITFQIACVFSMPPVWPKKDPTKIFKKNNIKTNNELFNSESIQSVKKKPFLKTFNFPEVDYSSARFTKPIRHGTALEDSPNVKVLDQSEFLNNFRKEKRRQRKYGGLKMPDDNITQRNNNNIQNYLSQIEAFPQMEFPLTASEIWAPNYYNHLSFPLHDPYFDVDKNIYAPQNNQKCIQSNSIKKGKYATAVTANQSKAKNKIDLTPKKDNIVSICKKPDTNVLHENYEKFAEMKMPNTREIFKIENNNEKPGETSENASETSKPKQKPKTRKIKIITKSSNVLRDFIAKKSNISTCSVQNDNSSNDCSPKNQNETTNHAISDVLNDRKNTEISDLLSDDFDVCFVNQNTEKSTKNDSQICVSFDHDTSTGELLPISNTIKLSKNDSNDLFVDVENHTVNTENNCSVVESDKSTKNFEKIVISGVPVEKVEQIITDIKETPTPFEKDGNQTSHKTQNLTKKLSDICNDEFCNDKSIDTNSSNLENLELQDEVKDIKEVDTDTVLSDLERAIVNSKIDGTIDTFIPKIKQAILEAIVESAAFVPSHIGTGFSPSKHVNYNTNRYFKNDVELINTDIQHIDSPVIVSFMEEYNVSNQTTELNGFEIANVTETKTKKSQNTLSNDKELQNKTEPTITLTIPPQNSIKSTKDITTNEVVENEKILNYSTPDITNLKQNEKENLKTTYDLTTIIDKSLNNISRPLANKQLKDTQTSVVAVTESNTNYTNNEVTVDLSTTAISIDTSNYNKMSLEKMLHESNNHGDENSNDSIRIIAKNIDFPSNENQTDNSTVVYILEKNNQINNAHENDSAIDVLDSIHEYIISNQDKDTDIERTKIEDIKRGGINDDNSLTDAVDILTLKQDNINSSITSSYTLENNFSSPENNLDSIETILHYNGSVQNSSIKTFEQEEQQTTPTHNGNYLKELNTTFTDQFRWKMKYDAENTSQIVLNSDFETRVLYADDNETANEPQVQLIDVLEVDDNLYIDHNFDAKINRDSWLESNTITPGTELIIDTETLPDILAHEIKSDSNVKDHPSLNDKLSSDENTEEILNAILDVLCTEDSECNNNISINNTLHDNIKLADYAHIETNNEANKYGMTISNEDRNIVLYAEDENVSYNDSDSILPGSKVYDDLHENTDFENFENVCNESNVNVKNSNQKPLLVATQVDNRCSIDLLDKESADEAPETASDNKTVDVLEHLQENTKYAKKTDSKVNSDNDINTVAINNTKLEFQNTCTEEVADDTQFTTFNRNEGLLDVSSIENPPGDNNESKKYLTECMDSKLDENKSSIFETANPTDQNTATDELLHDIGDAEDQ